MNWYHILKDLWDDRGLVLIVIVPLTLMALACSGAVFHHRRDWLAISIVASVILNLAGFWLVWMVFLAVRKPNGAPRASYDSHWDR